jgi:hypothetical protein
VAAPFEWCKYGARHMPCGQTLSSDTGGTGCQWLDDSRCKAAKAILRCLRMYARSGTRRRGGCNSRNALQGAPEGRRRAGALFGETTRYLLVYEEGSMGEVTEAEVGATPVCSAVHRPLASVEHAWWGFASIGAAATTRVHTHLCHVSGMC